MVDARKAVILLSKRYLNLTNKEIAKRLNLSEPTLSKIISAGEKGRVLEINEFQKEYDIIKAWPLKERRRILCQV